MALVKCPECNKPVSTKATACPHCGAVRMSGYARTILVLVALGALGGYGAMQWPEYQRTRSLEQSAMAERADAMLLKQPPKTKKENVQRATYGAKVLRKSIDRPDGSTLEAARVGEKTGAICYEYRVLNNFGGTTQKKAVLTPDGKRVLAPGMEGFAPLWNQECEKKTGIDIAGSINWFGP